MDVIFEKDDAGVYLAKREFAHESLSHWQERVSWQVNSIQMFGKWHLEPRQTAWFGPAYRYSSVQWPGQPLTPELSHMARQIQGILTQNPWGNVVSDDHFNSVLLNLYRNGQDHMGWHRDNEPEMDRRFIASVSLGESRDFKIRHRASKDAFTVNLAHGDLLFMRNLQTDFEHALPKRTRVKGPRLNFTFRACMAGCGAR